jgi:hypothetical protein
MAITNTTCRKEQPDNDKSSQGFYQDWDARIPSTDSLQRDVRSRNATIHGEEAAPQFKSGQRLSRQERAIGRSQRHPTFMLIR